MSVTYGVLIRRATQEVALGSVALHSDPPDSPDAGRDVLAGYQDLLRALARHADQLLSPHLQPGSPQPPSPDRVERTARALADELARVAGRRSFETAPSLETSHWRTAAMAIGAAGDLLATHADRSGLPRSPDLLEGLTSREARHEALGRLGDLTATVLSSADEVTRQLVLAGVVPSKVRRRFPDSITAEVLARESAQNGGPRVGSALDDIRIARPSIDTTHPLAELGDRMAHLRRYAWAATQATFPAVDDLKVFAVLGVAIHTHAEAIARRTSTPLGDEPLLSDAGDALMPRSQLWRAVGAGLQSWQTAERAHPAIVGHTRRVTALLAEVAPLGDQRIGTGAGSAREVVQALRAAVQITEAIGGWNAATLDGLPRSRAMMRARALTGDQVTDDRALAAARLADRHIDVPQVAYRDLRDAYAAAAGKADPRIGVLEPVLTTQLQHAGDGNGLVIERE